MTPKRLFLYFAVRFAVTSCPMPNKPKKDAATLATLARANAKSIARQQVEKKLKSVWRPVVSRKVYEQHQRSGNTTFRLLIGYDKSGRKIMPQFGTARFTALAFQEAWNSAVQSNSQTDLTILNDVAQVDVRWAISELEKINCTLRQAVDFSAPCFTRGRLFEV